MATVSKMAFSSSVVICLLYSCVTLAFEEGPSKRPPFPPGILEDFEGEDVLVTHRYGQVLGRRVTQPYDTGKAFFMSFLSVNSMKLVVPLHFIS